MPTKKNLNIIGCGRLGRTLSRLWSEKDDVVVAGVCNRTLPSSVKAIEFIGAGLPCTTINSLPPNDLWLIATPDSEIETVVHQLDEANAVPKGAVVFHCSGSLSTNILQPLENQGAYIASIHPAHSFGDPQRSLKSFPGTWCALEGDIEALNQLRPLFESIGGKTFLLEASNKPLYHAALTVASNYLVTLLDISLEMLETAGLSREIARDLLSPIVLQTAANVFTGDTTRALTGPIARGDVNTVSNHLHILAEKLPHTLSIYRHLGNLTLPLSEKQGTTDVEQLDALRKLLSENTD